MRCNRKFYDPPALSVFGFTDMKPQATTPPGTPATTLRRKPRQSRARQTSQALQDAFVRLLIEQGYEAVTVRGIVALAGVGIGTFYEYTESKQALAALTIHLRIKALAAGLLEVAQALQGRPLASLLDALLDQQVHAIRADARAWAALFLLERQISSPDAYRKNYRRYVDAWEAALALARNAPSAARLPTVARMVHVLVYGAVSQAQLTQGAQVDWVQLRRELGLAARGYVRMAGE